MTPPRPSGSASPGSRRRSAPSERSTTSASSSRPARSWRCSAPTAQASRRPSTCCSASPRRTAGRSRCSAGRRGRPARRAGSARCCRPAGCCRTSPCGSCSTCCAGSTRRRCRWTRCSSGRASPTSPTAAPPAVRRPAAAGALRVRAAARPRPARARRADRRDGRAEPGGVLGGHARLGRGRPHGAVRDALPRGGRRRRRPGGAAARAVAWSPTARRRDVKALVGGRTVTATLDGPPGTGLDALPGVSAAALDGRRLVLRCTDSDARCAPCWPPGPMRATSRSPRTGSRRPSWP